MKRFCLFALGLWLAGCPVAWAVDTIKKVDGSQVQGQITKMSALEVAIETNAVTRNVPVNEIDVIYYENEPSTLRTVRTAIQASQYQDALQTLERIKLDDVGRLEVKQDIEFYKALCSARLALEGIGTIQDAGRKMVAFVTGNTGNYHYWEACEVVADLLVALGNHAEAQKYYTMLSQAPWPDFKMRANTALGWAQLAQGKPAEALKFFQAVLEAQVQGEQAERQKLSATLGKARCLTEAGQPDEAIKLVDAIINRPDLAEQTTLQARAWNVLGTAHRKAGRIKEALLAFLRVDILYFSSARDHIEALENLVELWNQVQKPERAAAAAQILREQYKRTPPAS